MNAMRALGRLITDRVASGSCHWAKIGHDVRVIALCAGLNTVQDKARAAMSASAHANYHLYV